MKKIILIISLILGSVIFYAFWLDVPPHSPIHDDDPKEVEELVNGGFDSIPPFLKESHPWADSIIDSMNLDQKIGQLFMVAAYSNRKSSHEAYLKSLITKYHIGGLIFMQGTPSKQLAMTNRLQKTAKIPLLIAMDAEWGLSMRLKNTSKYPKEMTLGAIQNDSLIYTMGANMATEFHRMGVHVNFAPVVDVNNNPKNPVINYRSFGENRENVTQKGLMYMKGMQDNNVLACAKHFPGHGDTDSDSHLSLPIINHHTNRLDSIELYPFKQMIGKGIGSMMIAHLFIPALDTTKNRPTTLSKKVVTDLLQEKLKFKGLIFTDALNMKGASNYAEAGKVDAKALIAGNDMLLFSEDVPKAIAQIKLAIKNKEITEEEINQHVKKILYTKDWAINDRDTLRLKTKNLKYDVNSRKSDILIKNLHQNALTLVKNKNNLLPLQRLDTLQIALVNIGTDKNKIFETYLKYYKNIKVYSLSKTASANQVINLQKKLKSSNLLIFNIHQTKMNGSYGITNNTVSMISVLAKNKKAILNLSSNPYALSKFKDAKNLESIIVSYEANKHTEELVPQLIFGGISASGTLPVTASKYFKGGMGIKTKAIRNSFVYPEEIDIANAKLKKIEHIVNEGIKIKAFPGCQIVALKDGKIFYNKAFGHHTYAKKNKVKTTDIYDIASITKIMVTTPIIMKMVEEGKISLNDSLKNLLPEYADSNDFSDITIKEMLTHQAGFTPWIPFYKTTLNEDNSWNTRIYSKTKNSFYTTPVAKNMYIYKNYQRTILKRIFRSSIKEEKKYRYSDIGYYILQKIIQKKTGRNIDYVIDSLYYSKIGMYSMLYNPKSTFKANQITPTENDTLFRKQIIHGYVHDQGAAMLGGIGGHAGIFANAVDIAKMMYIYMNNGNYGGEQLLKKETINTFTTAPFTKNDNRRGIGFDKPKLDLKGGPTCNKVSLQSYGHTGFTGTMTWADPKNGLVYVFLSNRVYPDANNWLIVRKDIRTRIQEVLYDAVK